MFFGDVPLAEAEGGVLAHRVMLGRVTLPKGHCLSAADCRALAAEGAVSVTIARVEPGDIGEDAAAARIAAAVAGPALRISPPFTGRANLFAEVDGVLRIDVPAIHRFNAVDEGLTLATLPPFRRVVAGEMVATVKIIPFALQARVLAAGLDALGDQAPLAVAPFRAKRVGMIALTLPSLKASTIAKTRRVTEARLAALGSEMVFHEAVPHRRDALAALLMRLDPASFDILLIFGAAAITDRRDVIPAAMTQAGGGVLHLGMPVDPGNLLLLGTLAGKPVIGAPGCARAPAENGFDWVLERLVADLPVSAADIRAMGLGGLLMEIISRPQPRAGAEGVESGGGA